MIKKKKTQQTSAGLITWQWFALWGSHSSAVLE